MELNTYQSLALKTKKAHTTQKDEEIDGLLGLAGEAGEVCDLLKKHYAIGAPLDRTKLIKELGDVLWYLAELGHAFNFTLDEIASVNLEKLAARHGESFSGVGNRQGKGQ